MAIVRLGRYEVEKSQLPPVCMRCGAPAALVKNKNFRWYPSWVNVLILVGLLPYIIVAAILTKRMTVRAPLCAAHSSHWLANDILIPCGLAAVFIVPCSGGFFINAVGGPRAGNSVGPFILLGLVGGLVVWIIAAVVVSARTIRPQEITDRSITLTGVSPAFAAAVEKGHVSEGSQSSGLSSEPGSEQFYERRQ